MSRFNRHWTLFHLRESLEELSRTIESVDKDPDYCEPEFRVAMQHLYHHLNTAWNARGASKEEAEACSEEDFYKWRRFPDDMLLDEGP